MAKINCNIENCSHNKGNGVCYSNRVNIGRRRYNK